MNKIKGSLLLLLAFIITTALIYLIAFTIPDKVKLNISQGDSHNSSHKNSQPTSLKDSLRCFENKQAEPIDQNSELNILVWNIYKQSKPNWQQALKLYTQDTRLALLQEVSMTDEFKDYTKGSTWFSSHVDAFSIFGLSTGVLTLSTNSPLLACAHIEFEPWLQLPKSGIYATFRLSDGRKLVVVNLHSVNFTYGVEEYEKQIHALVVSLKKHQGPIIFAGDLNAWSLERIDTIKKTFDQLGLIEVKFDPDNRKEFINGLALDYVFYRELKLISSETPITDASDHNPLLVKFRL